MNLFGAKAIIRFLKTEYNYSISRSTLDRMRKRDADPFPVTDRIIQSKQVVVANITRVRAWAKRNLPQEPPPEEPGQRVKVPAGDPLLLE